MGAALGGLGGLLGDVAGYMGAGKAQAGMSTNLDKLQDPQMIEALMKMYGGGGAMSI